MVATPFNPFEAMARIEDQVHARHSDRALNDLVAFADQLHVQYFIRNLPVSDYAGNPYLLHGGLCERFVNAWGTALLDDGLDTTRLRLPETLRALSVIHELAHGSAAGNLDAFAGVLERRLGGRYTVQALLRILLLWVPGSRTPLDFPRFHPMLPEVVTGIAVATVAGLVMATPEAHRARESAIAFLNSGVPKPADFARVGMSRSLLSAWMFCSYAHATDKHGVKRFLNSVIAALPEPPRGAPVAPHTGDGRPVMVVPLEYFQSTHAMYRCYAPVIEACRKHFFLVGLVTEKWIDDQARGLFDALHVIDRECRDGNGPVNISQVAALVQSYAPAIVFYPSIGMQDYTILLANRRLAPVQAMTYGHPATSGMPSIDYGLTEAQWIIDPARFTETMVPLPKGALRYALHAEAEPVTLRRQRGDVLRVAVPSVGQKWTWPFLQALARVQARVGRRVEFVFFSGVAGTTYPAAVNAVMRALPAATVNQALSYREYTTALAQCDVHAATFPFGGTNSVFDSLTHGLPVVCLAATEIHGAQDGDFLQRAGLPDWLVAGSVDQFVDNLVRLVENPALVDELQARLADRERTRSVFVQGGDPEAFAGALVAIARKGGTTGTP